MAAFQHTATYQELHQWSIDEPAAFWQKVWDFTQVIGDPGTKLNFAENLLRYPDNREAIKFQAEDKVERTLTRAELLSQTARTAQALKNLGVQPGDRIAAWLPNMPETIIAMLAAASVGAVFSSCSPDFGVEGVIDRFGQIEPVVLFVADGYFYDGKTFRTLETDCDVTKLRKRFQVAARPAAKIENGERRWSIDMPEQGINVLTHIVVAGARPKIFGTLVVMLQRGPADFIGAFRNHVRSQASQSGTAGIKILARARRQAIGIPRGRPDSTRTSHAD